jgi:hypothetical protein
MGGAYTPGLTIAASATIRRTRLLPIRGRVLVQTGQHVTADTDVAQVDVPGTLAVAKVVQALGCTADQVESLCCVREGDRVTRDQTIASRTLFFGLITHRCRSPRDGTVEYISKLSGNVGIRGDPTPVTCKAYLSGVVAEVMEGEGVIVETAGALVQGIFGVGGEQHGALLWLGDGEAALRAGRIEDAHRGRVVVHPGRLDGACLAAAAAHGVAGLVGASIVDADLMQYLGYDIGVAITGQERIPFSLVLTEGFGEMTMPERTRRLLESLDGREAAINGATQIRAGVIRPEIIVPQPGVAAPPAAEGAELEMGTRVRCIRRPHFGRLGTVMSLPAQPVRIGTGSLLRVLTVQLDNGPVVTIPRANAELLLGG